MNGILTLAFKLLVNDSATFTALTGYGIGVGMIGRCHGSNSAQPGEPWTVPSAHGAAAAHESRDC